MSRVGQSIINIPSGVEVKKVDNKFLVKGSMPFYQNNSKLGLINLQTNKFNIKTDNLNFLLDSDLDLSVFFGPIEK